MSEVSIDEAVDDPSALEILTQLYEDQGELTGESIVKAATSKSSPLHKYFDWDDKIAAEKWRLEQAYVLVGRMKIIIDEQPVRAFLHVDSVGTYAPIQTVMQDVDWRAEVLERFRRDMETFKNRWANHAQAAKEYRKFIASEARRLKH